MPQSLADGKDLTLFFVLLPKNVQFGEWSSLLISYE